MLPYVVKVIDEILEFARSIQLHSFLHRKYR